MLGDGDEKKDITRLSSSEKLKKGEETLVKSIECTKQECLGFYKDDTAFYFDVKLNQFFISAIKRNGIDYRFNSNPNYIKNKIKVIENNRNYAIVMDLDEAVLDNQVDEAIEDMDEGNLDF